MSHKIIEIHNPTYAQAVAVNAPNKVPFPRFEQGVRMRVTFLNNEKPNTTQLLDVVEAELASRYDIEARTFLKGGASFAAPQEMIEEIARSTDVAILSTAD